MEHANHIANADAEEVLGEWHPLVEQLGSSEAILPLTAMTEALRLPRITHLDSLIEFLEVYKSKILIPIELPAILRAHRHGSRHQTRELIELDRKLLREPLLEKFSSASQRVGQNQLRRLRPLRDDRLLQRYLLAVEENRAVGWHTLVYGVTLSIYQLPVRQGLVFYERQTLRGFLHASSNPLRLSVHDCRQILSQLCSELPHDLETLTGRRPWTVTSTR